MAEFFFLHDKSGVDKYGNSPFDLINLSGNLTIDKRIYKDKKAIAGVSYMPNSPAGNNRLFEDDKILFLFAGDIIENEKLNYKKIHLTFKTKNYKELDAFEGIYAFLIYDKIENSIFALSDRRAQLSVYFYIHDDIIAISTSPAALAGVIPKPEIDPQYLLRYQFFNFYVGNGSFLKGVKRLQFCETLSIDLNDGGKRIVKYCERWEKAKTILRGKEALEKGKETFAERIKLYYPKKGGTACALTGGWDGRTILALAPDYENTVAYTYGMKNCRDLRIASKHAYKAGVEHEPIYFERDFSNKIPELFKRTVYLSFGQQNGLRSVLPYVYERLTNNGKRFSATLSGIDMDSFFRGHFGAAILTSEAISFLNGNFKEPEKSNLTNRARNKKTVKEELGILIQEIEEKYNSFKTQADMMRFQIYDFSANYFGGEFRIANNYTTIRVPAFDSKIIELAFSIEYSSLTYNDLKNDIEADSDEFLLQAFVIASLSRRFCKLPVNGVSPYHYIYKPKLASFLRIKNKINESFENRFLIKGIDSSLEDWNKWLLSDNRDFVEEAIFSNSANIREFFNDDYLNALRKKPDLRQIGNLIYFNLLIKLVNNNWKF